MDNNKKATAILEAVGGKENIESVAHCMTRLRFNLKDENKADDEAVKSISGISGVVRKGGQYQVIVGQSVDKVFDELKKLGVNADERVVDANEGDKEPFSFKKLGSVILDYLSGSVVPLIPIIMSAALFKTVISVFGPDLLNVIPTDGNLAKLFGLIYTAGNYFLPIYLGYTAARKIGLNPVFGLFMGGILISPDLINMVNSGDTLKIFGMNVMMNNYAQSMLPILLSVVLMYFVEKLVKKYMPTVLSTLFTPFVTILITVPITLLFLAPLGAFLADYVGAALIAIGNWNALIAMVIIAATWEYIIMTGMHMPLVLLCIGLVASQGQEGIIAPAAYAATFAAYGVALGAFLRMKNKEEKAANLGYFISALVGGVTEPLLYGTAFKYKRPFIGMMIGAAVGAAYAAITGVKLTIFGPSNFVLLLGYAGLGTANLVNGIISCVLAMVVTAAVVYFTGFDPNDPVVTKE